MNLSVNTTELQNPLIIKFSDAKCLKTKEKT